MFWLRKKTKIQSHSYLEAWTELQWSIFLHVGIIRASMWENLSSEFVNNKGTDQPAHTRRLISAFVIHFLESIISKLAIEASLTADLGVASSIPTRFHIFVEIDHEIISTVILLPPAESFKKGCCQLQAKVCAPSTG